MSWTLQNLIKASGNAGTSGQSFLSHVTGAASGVKMSDYKVTAIAMEWRYPALGAGVGGGTWNSGLPTGLNGGSPWPDGAVFDIKWTCTRGSAAFNIQKTTGGVSDGLYIDTASMPRGSSAVVTSYVNSGSNGTLTLTLNGGYPTPPVVGGGSRFQSPPTQGSATNSVETITFYGQLNGGLAGSGSQDQDLAWIYSPVDTIGPGFNPDLNSGGHGIYLPTVADRAEDGSTWDWEWYDAASGGTRVATTQAYDWSGTTGGSGIGTHTQTFWVRAKLGAGGWSSRVAVTWTDPRYDDGTGHWYY